MYLYINNTNVHYLTSNHDDKYTDYGRPKLYREV